MEYFCSAVVITGLCHQWHYFRHEASSSIEIYSRYASQKTLLENPVPSSIALNNDNMSSSGKGNLDYEDYENIRRTRTLHDVALEVLRDVRYYPSPYCLIDHRGQLQTSIQYFLRNLSRVFSHMIRHPRLYVQFTRELITLPDGGTVAIDWASVRSTTTIQYPPLRDDSPIMLFHHGLVGDSQSEYLFHLTRKMLKQGYRVGVMIARGCGGLTLTTHYTFTGRKTLDIRICIETVKRRYPESKLYWMGFSLGAAATLQYLEDFDRNSHLTAVMCVSPPWSLKRRPVKFDIWSFMMTLPLKIYILKHYKVLKDHSTVGILRLLMVTDIEELDTLCYRSYGGLKAKASTWYNSITSFSKDNLNSFVNNLVKEASQSFNDLASLVSGNSSSGVSGAIKRTISKATMNTSITTTAMDVTSNPTHNNNNKDSNYLKTYSDHHSIETAEEDVIQTLQYKSLEEYYRDVSPCHNAHVIRTPCLSISARDDPICYHQDCPTDPKSIGQGLVVVSWCMIGFFLY